MKHLGMFVFVASCVVLSGCGMETDAAQLGSGAQSVVEEAGAERAPSGPGTNVCAALERAYENAGSDAAKGAIFAQMAAKDCLVVPVPKTAGNDCRALGGCWKCDGDGISSPLCHCVLCRGKDAIN